MQNQYWIYYLESFALSHIRRLLQHHICYIYILIQMVFVISSFLCINMFAAKPLYTVHRWDSAYICDFSPLGISELLSKA